MEDLIDIFEKKCNFEKSFCNCCRISFKEYIQKKKLYDKINQNRNFKKE